MKVVCINRNNGFKKDSFMSGLYGALTIGKCYDADNFSEYSGICGILNDDNFYAVYNSSCFITLKEYRKLKLEKLNVV